MAKKISATINAPGHESYRAYFHDDGETVWVWAAGTQAFGYDRRRFGGGGLSRDWVRNMCAFHDTGTTINF